MKYLKKMFKKKIVQIVQDDKKSGPIECVITDGKYEGMKFVYGLVSFQEPIEPTGFPVLKFTYQVTYNPNDIDVNEEDLKKIMGDNILNLIEEQGTFDVNTKNGRKHFEKSVRE